MIACQDIYQSQIRIFPTEELAPRKIIILHKFEISAPIYKTSSHNYLIFNIIWISIRFWGL